MTALLLAPLADAFLQVGAYVALMVAGFAVLRNRLGGRMEAAIARGRRSGPVIGAVLGVTPGCGGAIAVMPLYLRGATSFGTVVAALVATMGDASFVIMAAAPRTALVVHAILFVCGVVCGVVVDLLGIAPSEVPTDPTATTTPDEGDPRPATRSQRWFLGAAVLGGILGTVLLLTGADTRDATALGRTGLVAGVAGTLLAVAVWWRHRQTGAHPHGVIAEAAHEAGFVTACVAAVFVATDALTITTGFDPATFGLAAGITGVLGGVLLGLIPGCGPQVALTGLYVSGAVGFPVLLANALSQDGDALFPLLFRRRGAAVLATAITTVPAVMVGAAVLLLAP